MNRRDFLKRLVLALPAVALAPAALLRRDPMDGELLLFQGFFHKRPGSRYLGSEFDCVGPMRCGKITFSQGVDHVRWNGSEFQGQTFDGLWIDEEPPYRVFPAANQMGKTHAQFEELWRMTATEALGRRNLYGRSPLMNPDLLQMEKDLNRMMAKTIAQVHRSRVRLSPLRSHRG
jgi:hypothetical protein